MLLKWQHISLPVLSIADLDISSMYWFLLYFSDKGPNQQQNKQP